MSVIIRSLGDGPSPILVDHHHSLCIIIFIIHACSLCNCVSLINHPPENQSGATYAILSPISTSHLGVGNSISHAYNNSRIPSSRSHEDILARVLAARLPHLKLLTSLQDRPEATISKAESCGLIDVPFADLVTQSDVVLSILPPSWAVWRATEIIAHKPDKKPIFVDANSVSAGIVGYISSILETKGIPFIDGCIIGIPAGDDFSSIPKLYLSASPELEDLM